MRARWTLGSVWPYRWCQVSGLLAWQCWNLLIGSVSGTDCHQCSDWSPVHLLHLPFLLMEVDRSGSHSSPSIQTERVATGAWQCWRRRLWRWFAQLGLSLFKAGWRRSYYLYVGIKGQVTTLQRERQDDDRRTRQGAKKASASDRRPHSQTDLGFWMHEQPSQRDNWK